MIKKLNIKLFIYPLLLVVLTSFSVVKYNILQDEANHDLNWYLQQYQSMDKFSLKMEYIMYDENKNQVDYKKAFFIKDGTSYKYKIHGELIIYQNERLNVGVYANDSIITISEVEESNNQLPNKIVSQEELKFFTISKKEENKNVDFTLDAKQKLPIQQVSMRFNTQTNLVKKTVIQYNDKITEGKKSYRPTLNILYDDWKSNQSYNASEEIEKILEYDFKNKECQLNGKYKNYQLIDLYKKNN